MAVYENPPYYLTAYGLAVKRGFVGTLDEWLNSLVGPEGPQGKSVVILGRFETEEALKEQHPSAASGDYYLVGSGDEERVYYWSEEAGAWDSFLMRGKTGPEGPEGKMGPMGPMGI